MSEEKVFVEKFSPEKVAALIRSVDPDYHDPSPEQRLIISIESNPPEPAVIIAGAGSGKTETMAARVVYLVANGFYRPDQILGLTFTRKAAGELNTRIRKRLKQLNQALANTSDALTLESFDTSVTTYHSYAGRILSEHSIRLGLDAEQQPLGEAALWMMANRIVRNWDSDGFDNDSAPSTVIDDLMGLTSSALEHKVDGAAIIAEDEKLMKEFEKLGGINDGVRNVIKTSQQRIALVEMMDEFIKIRRADGQLSFDDQIALAAQIAENFPDVGEVERAKYPIVLLDEYQDTSHSQVRLLSTLFTSGHAVTAVGDPCQSIYTWRGAAAGTIGAFNTYFPKKEDAKGSAQYDLTTSYRNDKSILDAANLISEEVRIDTRITVKPLQLNEAKAEAGDLVCGIFENRESEAQAIVDYFRPLWGENDAKIDDKSFAILVRKKSQIPVIQAALTSAGLPFEVLGLGGLVHTPEVADIVSLLKVIASPDQGGALMRHLTGPRINLGPRDIAALGRYSSLRARSESRDSNSIVKNIISGNPIAAENDDIVMGSLIDALDEIKGADQRDFSPEGYARLVEFSQDLRRLRTRAAGPITDLVLEIERYLNLEAEVLLREEKSHGRRHLDRFLDEASKFARSGGSLDSFVQWLTAATEEEGGLKAGAPEVDKSVIQILTVHNAKGAEWDVVAIPGLTEGTFPSGAAKSPENWLTNERFIPFALRRDKDAVPQFSLGDCTTSKEASEIIKEYGKECVKYRRGEEIRLGYVAVTRAKKHLFCSATYYATGVKPLKPSSLYMKVREIALVQGRVMEELEAPGKDDRNPREFDEVTATWPVDPLGPARAAFDASVELVKKAQPYPLDIESELYQSWISDARAIIAEAKESRVSVLEIPRPVRMSPSSIIAMKKNPTDFARSIRRPMPRARDEYSSRGTAFHLWIEHHLKGGTIFSDEDFQDLAPIEDDRTLEELKEKWMASEWATRDVYKVEAPFETVIAGVLVRGRIDAVYKTDNGFEVVDWKTGSRILDEDSAIQLAIYRLAWAKLADVPVESVSGAFHYVPTGVTDRREKLMSEDELHSLLS
jgi:DNA helicase-2/ATP-dependent DNA helicase PcrA